MDNLKNPTRVKFFKYFSPRDHFDCLKFPSAVLSD